MKNNFKYTLFIIGNILLASSLFGGGGWPQPKGKSFIKLSQWWTVADKHYTDLGEIDPNNTLGIFNTSIYAEHGFTDRLTGIVYFPFFSRSYNNNLVSATTGEILVEGDAINSIGDTDIMLKYGLTNRNSKIAVAGTILFGLPLGNDQGGVFENLQTGDGEFNQMIQVDAGTGINLKGNLDMYTNAYVAYNNRTKGFSDEVRVGAELGIGINNYKWLFISRLNILRSTKNGTLGNQLNSTSIFANNTEFTSLGFELNYSITNNIGVSAGYATATSGRIIIANPSYSVGVFVKL